MGDIMESLIKRPRTVRNGRGHGPRRNPLSAQKPIAPRGWCSIEECDRPAWARTWCSLHYNRWSRNGDPLKAIQRWTQTPEERFWAKVHKTEGCWVWTAPTNGGYGHIAIDGRCRMAHRVAYEWSVGPIPAGLVIDHLCRNRACVNPAHMEVVTHQVNILQGTGASASAARRTHCPQGHLLDGRKSVGSRYCKTCNRERERRKREARA
jgi:hypothetical protein